LITIEPESKLSKPAIALNKVDFPDPEGPNKATNLWSLTSKLTFSNAWKLPNFLETFLILILMIGEWGLGIGDWGLGIGKR
jgi:hypothetical protein